MALAQMDVRIVNSDAQLVVQIAADDDTLLAVGKDNDAGHYLRSTALTADAEITSVIVGTSDHQGVAANSLIITNITQNGDVLGLVNNGGNSLEWLLVDASAKRVHLGFAGFTVEMLSSVLRLRSSDAADGFAYTIVSSNLAADRNLTIPLLTADDTIAVLGLAQTFTAQQTLNSGPIFTNGLKVGGTADNQTLDDVSTGTGTITLYIGNNTINVTAPSDIRLKKNFRPIDALPLLTRLRTGEFDSEAWGPGKWVGFDARQAASVIPNLGFKDNKGFWRFRGDLLMPHVINTIQTLDQRITQLELAARPTI